MGAGLVLGTAEELEGHLLDMNERGECPTTVVGFDRHGYPFLAYAYTPDGEGVEAAFVSDDGHGGGEFDYSDGTKRCEECGADERRGVELLAYPVTLIPRPGEVAP